MGGEPQLQQFDPFLPILTTFAQRRGMPLSFSTDDGPKFTLNWRTQNGYDCFMALEAMERPARFELFLNCFAPSFPQTHFPATRLVPTLTSPGDAALLWSGLEAGRRWAEGLKECLDEHGRPCLEPMLAALGDPAPGRREIAVNSLGETGDPRAIEPLISILRADANPSVRARAAGALGHFQDPGSQTALQEASSERNLFVRACAALALVERGTSAGVEALTEILWQSGASMANLSLSNQILPGISAIHVWEALARALRRDDPEIAARAAYAMRALGQHAFDPLVAALRHPAECQIALARSRSICAFSANVRIPRFTGTRRCWSG